MFNSYINIKKIDIITNFLNNIEKILLSYNHLFNTLLNIKDKINNGKYFLNKIGFKIKYLNNIDIVLLNFYKYKKLFIKNIFIIILNNVLNFNKIYKINILKIKIIYLQKY